MKKKSKKIIIIILTAAFAFAVLLYCYSNFTIASERFDIKSAQIPSDFEGYRITQISDLQGIKYLDGGKKLLSKVSVENPDIIVITGDLIDRSRKDITPAAEIAAKLCEIAPVYYVNGNHEAYSGGNYDLLRAKLKESGAEVLEDKGVSLKKGKSEITLIGLDDLTFRRKYYSGQELADATAEKIASLKKENCYTVVLSHRPELAHYYAKGGADLTFCGHAHGGQIRLPFIGGLYAPEQGFFPEYTDGLYEVDNMQMLVSRGLGYGRIAWRINNTPEILTAVLHTK